MVAEFAVRTLYGVGADAAAARALQPEARMDTPPNAPAPVVATTATPPSLPLVIYHADCTDGFAAAWAAHHAFDADTYVELFPAVYRQPPPDVTGRDVYVVDFSYDRPTLLAMHAQAKSLVVLDHHRTAAKELEGLDFCVFDQSRSGAGLAWDLFAKPTRGPRPRLVDYVEDRDLWRWALPHSREVNAYLGSLPHRLADFEEAAALLEGALGVERAAALGRAVLLAQARYVERSASCARMMAVLCPPDVHDAAPVPGLLVDGRLVHDVEVPVVNCGPWCVSEVLERLGALHPNAPFVVAWYERADGRLNYSLRSDKRNPIAADVSRVAELHGGGGHRHAAGFDAPPGRRADVARTRTSP